MYCKHCGSEVDKKAEICTKCGVRIRTSSIVNPTSAAALSLFMPGVGQFYNRELWKGTTFLIAISVLLVTSVVLIVKHISSGMIVGVLWLILWIYNVYDAYRCAKKINDQNM